MASPRDGPQLRNPGAAEVSSAELIRDARAGDRQALDHLCTRYLPRLRRWARGRLPAWARDRFDTDDLVQETLVRSLGQLGTFEARGEGALQAYMRQALLNGVRDEVRRAAHRPPAPPDPPERVDSNPSPLEEALGRETVERYEAALAGLREDDRAAIVARIEMGCSYSEVAEALGKPSPDAARMAVGRALVRLAEAMGDGEVA
jgi:RNA polymerase sigma-70 factor (ECF subfamily)